MELRKVIASSPRDAILDHQQQSLVRKMLEAGDSQIHRIAELLKMSPSRAEILCRFSGFVVRDGVVS